jgi:hypothetical protein
MGGYVGINRWVVGKMMWTYFIYSSMTPPAAASALVEQTAHSAGAVVISDVGVCGPPLTGRVRFEFYLNGKENGNG